MNKQTLSVPPSSPVPNLPDPAPHPAPRYLVHPPLPPRPAPHVLVPSSTQQEKQHQPWQHKQQDQQTQQTQQRKQQYHPQNHHYHIHLNKLRATNYLASFP